MSEKSMNEMLTRLKKLGKQRKGTILQEEEWQRMLVTGSDSGSGDVGADLKETVKTYAKLEADNVLELPDIKIPNWVKALAEKKVTAEEMAIELLKRVERAPSTSGLFLAQAAINELLKTKKGQKAVARILTKETVRKFITLSQPQ
jgi:hypothetical protein